ncbi:MAG: flagellar protein FlaG [Porticoccaceae bacterium]|nr:flagellar protein FlaG [Porticoccaceae bacterium]
MSSPDIKALTPLPVQAGNNLGVRRQGESAGGKVSPQAETVVQQQETNRETVEQAVVQIADYVQTVSRDLQFQVDDASGYTLITVRDSETEEVIRQIPSEEVVALARYIADNGSYPGKGSLINSES